MQNLVTPTVLPSYRREEWIKGYLSQPNEGAYWIEEIEGEIPANLRGTLFRNGPGLMDVGGQPFAHPFDGDGMICAFSFCPNGKVYFQNRFVRTEAYIAEQKAQKILYRGFGTQKPGGWLANCFDTNFKNAANTNVLYWADRLWALWEGGSPHRLDPANLETVGRDRFLASVLDSNQPLSAHPTIIKGDDGEERLVTYSVKAGLSSKVEIFEFDRQGKLLKKHAHILPGFAFLHDMAVTTDTCIFFQNPVTLDGFSMLFGLKGADKCIQFRDDRPTKVVLISRNGDFEMQVLETDPNFIFHYANAWEEGDKIWVEAICLDYFPQLDPDIDFRDIDPGQYPKSQLRRFCIDRARKTVDSQLVETRSCEFPQLNRDRCGRPYRYLYVGATDREQEENSPLQAVMKIDWHTGERQLWSAAPSGFVSEPIFVPAPDGVAEDDGWLLVLVYDGAKHRSKLVILDARDLQQGAIAQLHLPYHIPYGFHGMWTSFLPNLQ
ncbi:MAG: carotenoid oxygenase family protein [Cyanobacteria bacterium P01_E01_bin.42]